MGLTKNGTWIRTEVPDRTAVYIGGDAASSTPSAMELATASQYRIGTRVLILSNEFHEMTYDGKMSTAALALIDAGKSKPMMILKWTGSWRLLRLLISLEMLVQLELVCLHRDRDLRSTHRAG